MTRPPVADAARAGSQGGATTPADARLLFLGDVYLPDPVRLADELPGALVYNLEAPLTRATRGWPGTVNLRCAEDHTIATFGRRPAAVCLANNHIMDFGEPGLSETLDRLREAGVPFFGAGGLTENCNNPVVVPLDDHLIGLVGYVCPTAHPVFASAQHSGVAPIEIERIRRDVALARSRGATRVVVCLHWGIEEVELPRPDDVRLARAIAELGVDLIIGHHAHCIQPYETHRATPIYYGLGNAIFPDVEAWSEFDIAGVAGERYHKLQNYWNKPSLAVAYDVRTRDVRVDRLTCDGRVLRVVRRGVVEPQLRHAADDTYERRFHRHHFYATWRKKLVNYARKPKLPRARHLRSLVGILREARGTG